VNADILVAFIAQERNSRKPEPVLKPFGAKLTRILELEEYKGKEGEVFLYHTERKIRAPRLMLVGLGESKKLSLEAYRRAASTAAKSARDAHAGTVAFLLPPGPHSAAEKATALAEGAALGLYRYDKYLTGAGEKKGRLREAVIAAEDDATVRELKKALATAKIICEATCFARDLENAPPNELYPETLAAAAKASAAAHGFRITVWDKKRIEQQGFGGLLAVNSGSNRPARFLIMEHNSGNDALPTIVLVGKGVTFDAGGISIKPANGMSEMKMDMGGAAAVIGTMEAASRLKLPVHLVGLVPTTENLLGGSAMRPGDIITHYGGKTSEVDNTDAEGRLILADALAYAGRYKPAAVIDLATLTGACVVALGNHATGMMGNDGGIMARLKTAGEQTFERVWELPLYEEYEKQIKSDVADVKNVGGRWGGAITAALFLKRFIGDYKWVHLDIAGTAILEENFPYCPRGGSGVGVRLLVEFLKNWKSD
jgi:leucyl aminopeptidase